MKYIDAEKLIAEIEKRAKFHDDAMKACVGLNNIAITHSAGWKEDNELLTIITSLQQEQPNVDLVAELKHHLATTPKEQLEKEWKELEPWSNIGPTVQEFLYGKQLDIDLEKEIDRVFFQKNCGSERLYHKEIVNIARHFFNLGLNARKEKNK